MEEPFTDFLSEELFKVSMVPTWQLGMKDWFIHESIFEIYLMVSRA